MRKDLFNLGPVFGYFFRKPDPNRPSNFNLRTMHFINKLSLGMFLVGFLAELIVTQGDRLTELENRLDDRL